MVGVAADSKQGPRHRPNIHLLNLVNDLGHDVRYIASFVDRTSAVGVF